MKIRLYEFKSDDKNNLLSFSQMQDAAPILQLSTIESTQNMLDNVQVVLSEILHSNVQHLHSIKHYPRLYGSSVRTWRILFLIKFFITHITFPYHRYVDVVANTLKQKLSLIDRMIVQQRCVQQKRDEAQDQREELYLLLKLIIQRTKELQAEVYHSCSYYR